MLADHLLNIVKELKTGNRKFQIGNEVDKARFAHDAAYSDSKDLAKRTISHKIFRERACKIPRNCGYEGYQEH